jgi:hypothetical protein
LSGAAENLDLKYASPALNEAKKAAQLRKPFTHLSQQLAISRLTDRGDRTAALRSESCHSRQRL